MSIISISWTFAPGGIIYSAQVNTNFSVIYNDYNGNVGNVNLSSSLVITDNKLAQIVSASKVNATAITNCSGLPSGAGQWPAANLPSQFASSIILSVSNSATQSINSSSWTQRTFGTVNEDSGGYWASNTYTPTIAGWYLVIYMDAFNLTDNVVAQFAIYKNGSLYAGAVSNSAGAGQNVGGTAAAIIQMNGSSDYIQFFLWHNNGSAENALGSGFSFASAVRVF